MEMARYEADCQLTPWTPAHVLWRCQVLASTTFRNNSSCKTRLAKDCPEGKYKGKAKNRVREHLT